MTQTTIATINNVNIVADTAEQLIPIRPICQALGVDNKAQHRRIYDDSILSSCVVMMTTQASDGRNCEMLCLPVRFVFGWLFSIDDKLVSESARENVVRYKLECYNALYDYFSGVQKRQIEQNNMEIRLLEEVAELVQQQSDLKRVIKEKKSQIELLREQRLKYEPTLF